VRRITTAVACLLACLPVAVAHATEAAATGRDDSTAFVVGSAGTFALVDELGYRWLLGVQYRGRPRTGWHLRPGLGVDAGHDDMLYLYADAARDFGLSRDWLVTLSLGAGWFANGEAIGANYDLEFKSGLALARRLASDARAGVAVYHVSNGGISHPNDGSEALVLFVAWPLRR
jgi:lipid A 3-O-deacylase